MRRILVLGLILIAFAGSIAAFVYLTFVFPWSTAYFVEGRQVGWVTSTSWEEEGFGVYLVYFLVPALSAWRRYRH